MTGRNDQFLTVNETAQRLRVSATTIRNWAADGRLTEHRTAGGHRRFRAQDVEQLARTLLPHRTPRVLVIDDDPAIRYVIREGLQAAGIEVTEAGSGLIGLDSMDEEPPSVVILDIMMPGLDGFQVMRFLERYNVRVPVLACSALGTRAAERARELGASDFLSKPFELHELVVKTHALMRDADERSLT